jgi:7-cyano-7-deazaguanine synthase
MIGLLLSGGMDSISIAWWKRPDVAISVDYGQRAAAAELEAAGAVCRAIGIRHEIVRADCSSLGSGDMAGLPPVAAAPVPEWWPFRNQLVLTLAGIAAVRLGVSNLMIGALATDGEHADGRPDFIEAISTLMSLQEGGITVTAPAISMTAVDLVRISGISREVLAWAHSCHIGDFACGQCRGCVKHYKTWEALGWDPH